METGFIYVGKIHSHTRADVWFDYGVRNDEPQSEGQWHHLHLVRPLSAYIQPQAPSMASMLDTREPTPKSKLAPVSYPPRPPPL